MQIHTIATIILVQNNIGLLDGNMKFLGGKTFYEKKISLDFTKKFLWKKDYSVWDYFLCAKDLLLKLNYFSIINYITNYLRQKQIREEK